jgi:transposase
LSDDTNKDIIKLIESGHRASQIAQSLEISKSTISRLLKRWRICGDTENISRTGRKQIVTKRAENTLSSVVKMSRRVPHKQDILVSKPQISSKRLISHLI